MAIIHHFCSTMAHDRRAGAPEGPLDVFEAVAQRCALARCPGHLTDYVLRHDSAVRTHMHRIATRHDPRGFHQCTT